MTTAVQLAQSVAPGVSLGFKNRIINGGMTIDQRNAGASATFAGIQYGLDRWQSYSQTGTSNTLQQVSDAPTGFTNSLKITVGTGAAPSAAQQNIIWQPIEGYNVADMKFGAVGASTFTISFWVKSSVTGTFNVWFQSNASGRAYVSTYTINSANTWEQKSVTIPGDTTGTWLKTNGAGLVVGWSLGCGSNFNATINTWSAGDYKSTAGATNLIATSGATFYITGVQLEVGTAATSFEFRDYGRELLMCQRYYENSFSFGNQPGVSIANTDSIHTTAFSDGNSPGTIFKVVKRAIPTVVLRAQGSTVTGQAGNSSGNTSATAINTGTSQVSYIEMGAKIAGSYVRYTYEANAEL